MPSINLPANCNKENWNTKSLKKTELFQLFMIFFLAAVLEDNKHKWVVPHWWMAQPKPFIEIFILHIHILVLNLVSLSSSSPSSSSSSTSGICKLLADWFGCRNLNGKFIVFSQTKYSCRQHYSWMKHFVTYSRYLLLLLFFTSLYVYEWGSIKYEFGYSPCSPLKRFIARFGFGFLLNHK